MIKGSGRRAPNKKAHVGQWIFLALITTVNLILSILLRIADRKAALQAIQNDDKVSVLYFGEKETKIK